jgi:hypothetical protein
VDYLEARSAHESVTYQLAEPLNILAHNKSNADVHIYFKSGPYNVVDAAGKVLSTQPPDSGNFIISFERVGDGWTAFFARNA